MGERGLFQRVVRRRFRKGAEDRGRARLRIAHPAIDDLAPPAAVHCGTDDLDSSDLVGTGAHDAATLQREEVMEEIFERHGPPPAARPSQGSGDSGSSLGRMLLLVLAAVVVGGGIGAVLFVLLVGIAWFTVL